MDPEQNGIAYSISGNDKDKVSVSESGNIILSKSLDYEDKRELQFVLEVFDGKNTVSTPVNIKIENVNELQASLNLSSPTVHEGGAVNSMVEMLMLQVIQTYLIL